MYDQFIAKWNNKQVTKYGGQCVAGVAEYESENGLPIVWGDAHQWINNPIMLSHYDWVQNNPNDHNQVPNRGDIIVWPLPNEHIAFFDMNLGNGAFQCFGQNSGGATMHFSHHQWSHAPAGWYTAKHAAPAPPPVPIQAEVKPYAIELILQKNVRINKPTHKWGLNYDNFTAINANPEGNADQNTPPITVSAILHHNIGYSYYLENPDVASGYNVLDCDDFIPAPPPPAHVVPTSTPAGAVTANSPPYQDIVVDVPGYMTATNAANHTNPVTTVKAGSNYFRFTTKYGMDNVTLVSGQPGAWINPSDNVLPLPPPPPTPPAVSDWTQTPPHPEPTPPPIAVTPIESWQTTYKPFRNKYSEPTPKAYVAMRPTAFIDAENKFEAKTMPQYDGISIAGTFEKDGKTWLRPSSSVAKYQWYGALEIDPATGLTNLEPYASVYNSKTTTAERKVTKNLKKTDYLVFATARIKLVEEELTKIMDVLRPKKKQK